MDLNWVSPMWNEKTSEHFGFVWGNLLIGSQAVDEGRKIYHYLPFENFISHNYITFAYYCRRLACVPLLFPGQIGSEYSKLQLVLLWLGVFAVWGCMWAWVYFILRNKRSVRYVTECYRSTKPAAIQVGLSKLIATPFLSWGYGLMKNSLSKSELPVLHACKCGQSSGAVNHQQLILLAMMIIALCSTVR